MQRGDHIGQNERRVRGAAAVLPRVHVVVERPDLHFQPRGPAGGQHQGWAVDAEHGRVADDDQVGRQVGRPAVEHSRKAVGARLLLAVDQDREVDGQAVAAFGEAAQGRAEHEDRALVVGRSAADQPPVPEDRVEWRHAPLGRLSFRLDVVVQVVQDRRPVRAGAVQGAEHDRMAGRLDHLAVLQPCVSQLAGHQPRRGAHVRLPGRVGRHRRHPYERTESLDVLRQVAGQPVTHCRGRRGAGRLG